MKLTSDWHCNPVCANSLILNISAFTKLDDHRCTETLYSGNTNKFHPFATLDLTVFFLWQKHATVSPIRQGPKGEGKTM